MASAEKSTRDSSSSMLLATAAALSIEGRADLRMPPRLRDEALRAERSEPSTGDIVDMVVLLRSLPSGQPCRGHALGRATFRDVGGGVLRPLTRLRRCRGKHTIH